MEKITFLLPATNTRIPCLLNPETMVERRTAGVGVRRLLGQQIVPGGQKHNPLMLTGGGTTVLEFGLLFDVGLLATDTNPTIENVRQLTAPLRQLAEQSAETPGAQPPIVRLMWGKESIPGVITAIAERLDSFTVNGMPQRSWVSLRMVQVDDITPPATELAEGEQPVGDYWQQFADDPLGTISTEIEADVDVQAVYEFRQGDRLETLAEAYYGDARLWRWLALLNRIDDPLDVSLGEQIVIPERSALRRGEGQ